VDVSEKKDPYVFFILLISILSLIGLAISTLGRPDQDQLAILEMADNVVCGLFFTDFLVSLYRAPNRWSYLIRWGWLDLLSSVPMINALRVTRLARIIRILRLIRGIKASKVIAHFVLDRRAESAFLAVSLVSLLLVVISSIAILQFEGQPDSNIKNAADAVWWAVATITSVGYGDKYPVTMEGRVVASFLMVCGVGLFGTFSGFVASWFLKPGQDIRDAELRALITEIRELRIQIKASK